MRTGGLLQRNAHLFQRKAFAIERSLPCFLGGAYLVKSLALPRLTRGFFILTRLKQVDRENAAAGTFRRRGKDWCIDKSVTVRNPDPGGRSPSSGLEPIARPEWEAAVTKKFGAEWAQ